MQNLLMTPAEAAASIGVGRTRIYDMIAKGVLPSVRIGRSVRVPMEGLKAWIEMQVAGSADPHPQQSLRGK